MSKIPPKSNQPSSGGKIKPNAGQSQVHGSKLPSSGRVVNNVPPAKSKPPKPK